MDSHEVNTIIAEFMGYELNQSAFYKDTIFANGEVLGSNKTNFSGSLDLLVPVWERLKAEMVIAPAEGRVFTLDFGRYISIDKTYRADTVQAAAATATAEAILKLREIKNEL